jgi:uncharacterized oxidoreductase
MRSKGLSLAGRTIVLTGATRGIGRALAEQLVAEGARVFAVARDRQALKQLHTHLGVALAPIPCDLEDASARAEMIARIVDSADCLDGLINNAGIQYEMAFFGTDASEQVGLINREIEVNLAAPVHLAALLLPKLANSDQAFLLNITSSLAIAPKEAAPVYSATKAGLRSFTTALRYQAKRSHAHVHVIEAVMALVDTDMTAGRGRGKITPARAARGIIRGIKQGREVIWVEKARLLPILARISPRIPARILR